MGQIDCRETRTFFGTELEGQGLSQVMWTNGVRGLLFTRYESGIGCANRLIGTEANKRGRRHRWTSAEGAWQRGR